jgi:hypothetical protein
MIPPNEIGTCADLDTTVNEFVERMSRDQKKRKLIGIGLQLAMIPVAAFLFLGTFILFPRFNSLGFCISMVILYLVISMGLPLTVRHWMNIRFRGIEKTPIDPAVVGPLIIMSDIRGELTHDEANQRTARVLLTSLLPKLDRNQWLALANSQRNILRKLVLLPNRDLTLATFNLWSLHGEEPELKTAQRIADGEAFASITREIREAAAACIPKIEKNIEATGLTSTLLRPVHPSIDPSQSLLLPVSGHPETAENLVRPVE